MSSDLQPIVAAIERIRADRDRVVVGVFGYAGSGKSVLARRLVDAVDDAVRLRGDDFLDPVRSHRLSDNWDGVERHRMRAEALDPFRAGGAVVYHPLDWSTGQLAAPTPLPQAAVLIVDSIGLPHPDLHDCFDLTVWLDVDLETARRRGMARDRAAGRDHDRLWTDVWSPNDQAFEQRFDPRSHADLVYSPGD